MSEDNPKLDWRDSLNRRAFEEALLRQRALNLVGKSDPEVLTMLEDITDCLQAIRAGHYDTAKKLANNNWATLEPALAGSEHAIKLLTSTYREDLEHALTIAHPLTLADAHNSLGRIAARTNAEEAEHHFKLALEADPRHHRALANLGNIDLERGEVEQAIERYREAIKLEPEYATAHNNLAAALRRQGKVSESVAALKKAQRLSVKQLTSPNTNSMNGTSSSQSILKSLKNPSLRWVLLGLVALGIYVLVKR